jgi:PAS domain S-box-containing protein
MQTLRCEFIADVELVNYETCLVTQDGSRKVISWNTFDVFNCEHQLERIVYFGIDITEQQLAEQNLAIAAIAFDTNLAMTIYNPEGELLRVNAAYTQLTGYTAEQLIGKSHLWLKSNLTPADFYVKKQAIINDTGLWSGELWSQRHGAEDYQEYRTINAVKNNEGILTHFVSTHEDITERKHQEELLIEAKEKAEHFSTLKTQFIAGMSHEIRTPMAAIIGFSELALLDELPEETLVYLQDINTASNSLLGILQDILDFTKLEAGYVVIEALPLNIKDLLGTIDTLFKGSAQQKGMAFTIAHDSTIPIEVLCDKLRVQQVLTNLVGNAIKFTKQGYVKLEISLQTMSATQVQLLFSVSDTGIGIALEDQDKLFQEFSQVDGSFTRKYGGTGLGLVISKELVELMGGEISVVSEKGLGSTFSFALSFDVVKKSIAYDGDSTAISEQQPSELYTNKFKGHRVLVVEDNAFSQKIIQKYLQNLGMDYMTAEHGEAALSLLEAHDFDIVLMDIHMPVMNGIIATEHIRQQEKYASLPIIALSAGVTESERNNCIACGMVGFISKPINFEQLCNVFELWLKPGIAKVA